MEAIETMESKSEVAKEKTPFQIGKWYLEQAMAFERSKTQDAVKSKALAWKCFTGSMIVTMISIIASSCLVFVNKPNPPAVLRINDATGDITILKTLADEQITYGEATDISFLKKYIAYRESYDWETIQDLYDATVLMSSPQEAAIYTSFMNDNNKNSPVNMLKDKVRIIANAGTVTFVGKTALVSFTKTIKPLGGQPPSTEYFVATITFEYQNFAMDEKQRSINPPGFKVTSYRTDRDVTKTSAVQSQAESASGSKQ